MDCSLANLMALGASLDKHAGVQRQTFGGIPVHDQQKNWRFALIRHGDGDDDPHELHMGRDGGPAQRWKLCPECDADGCMDADEMEHGEMGEGRQILRFYLNAFPIEESKWATPPMGKALA